MKEIDKVTIYLSEMPHAGDVQLLARVRPEDDVAVRKAARSLGLKQSEFLRTAIVLVARQVNAG